MSKIKQQIETWQNFSLFAIVNTIKSKLLESVNNNELPYKEYLIITWFINLLLAYLKDYYNIDISAYDKITKDS